MSVFRECVKLICLIHQKPHFSSFHVVSGFVLRQSTLHHLRFKYEYFWSVSCIRSNSNHYDNEFVSGKIGENISAHESKAVNFIRRHNVNTRWLIFI